MVDIEVLKQEIQKLQHLNITPQRLRISSQAHVILPLFTVSWISKGSK